MSRIALGCRTSTKSALLVLDISILVRSRLLGYQVHEMTGRPDNHQHLEIEAPRITMFLNGDLGNFP